MWINKKSKDQLTYELIEVAKDYLSRESEILDALGVDDINSKLIERREALQYLAARLHDDISGIEDYKDAFCDWLGAYNLPLLPYKPDEIKDVLRKAGCTKEEQEYLTANWFEWVAMEYLRLINKVLRPVVNRARKNKHK